MDLTPRGLYHKFTVTRTDGQDKGPNARHVGCHYFPLDLTHDRHARPAILAYAASCRGAKPELARDLEDVAARMAAGNPPLQAIFPDGMNGATPDRDTTDATDYARPVTGALWFMRVPVREFGWPIAVERTGAPGNRQMKPGDLIHQVELTPDLSTRTGRERVRRITGVYPSFVSGWTILGLGEPV